MPPQRRISKMPNLEGYEIHEVPLIKKEGQSLGISIIGYNALTSQDAVGVFVKHVVPDSAADHSGNIRVHDRLIALDGVSLHGLTNQEVLEVMKQTGQTVVLTLVRKKARVLERSLDKVERESPRVSLRRSMQLKAHSAAFSMATATPEPTHTNTTQLAMAAEPELRAKWEQALGPKYQVLVVELDPVIEDFAELQKYSKLLPVHTLRLGVELDSFDGHHYISSVAPGGPLDKHGVLRPEDELLEVNGVQLYGKSRREAVSFLREVPPPFTLICCRHPASDMEQATSPASDMEQATSSNLEPETEPEPQPEPGHTVEEIELKLSSLLCSQAAQRDSSSEHQQAARQEKPEEADWSSESSSDSGELALWSPDVQLLELQKEADRGLGFSILDYQDPVDAGRCVMVIRSLVPGGSAERQGGLLPGDQLVSVNQTQLDLLSLAEAVEVLKSAPLGTIRLGIRKPLVGEGPDGPGQREDSRLVMHTNTHLPVPKGFGDGSILPEDLRQEEEEPELILDGGLPRYASPLTSDLQPGEGREMAVDEEEEEQRAVEQTGRAEEGKEPDEDEVRDEEEEGVLTLEDEDDMSFGQLLGSRDSEADSELTLTDTDTESVRVTDTERRKRRSQGGAAPPIRGGHSDLPEREEGEGEETPAFSHWGPPRRVEVWPEEGQSLGLSIVGGRHIIKRLRNGEELKGIFIKQVLPDSPAARTCCLKTGDKILEVSGVDLQAASHDEAVNAIKSAPSPVVFIVQSLCAAPRKAAVAPPPPRQPPPYKPPNQSEQEPDPELEQAKGLVA